MVNAFSKALYAVFVKSQNEKFHKTQTPKYVSFAMEGNAIYMEV